MNQESAVMERTVAKDKPKRNDRAVKIEKDLAMMMNYIVDTEFTPHGSVAEYLSSIVRPIVERDYKKAAAAFEARKPKGKPPTDPTD